MLFIYKAAVCAYVCTSSLRTL